MLLALALLAILGVRAWSVQRGPTLEPWHTYVPDELDADAIDEADWPTYLAAERAAFAAVDQHVTVRPEPDAGVTYNRYVAGSPVRPADLPEDWDRSQVLVPDGTPAGAVVVLHGLTDSPYGGRTLVRRDRERPRARRPRAYALTSPGWCRTGTRPTPSTCRLPGGTS